VRRNMYRGPKIGGIRSVVACCGCCIGVAGYIRFYLKVKLHYYRKDLLKRNVIM
jgi:hypothetical protein